MSVKIKWNDNDITDIVATITWAGSAYSAARSVEFTLLNPAGDSHFSIPTPALGDVIKLYDDKNLLFYGKLIKRSRTGEAGTKSFLAYDLMWYLLKNKATYKFRKKKPEQIAALVCKDLKIKTKNIAKTNVKISKIFFQNREYYNIILAAYTKAKQKKGIKYQPIMDGKYFSVIKKGSLIDLEIYQNEGITESSYEESLESMVNKVVIYNSKNKNIGTVSNKNWVKTYGTMQDSISVDKGNGQKQAKNTLAGIDKSASITAIGDLRCLDGYGLKIHDTDSGLSGTFWIENDTHTFENGVHMMTLELAFKNVMETESGDSESKSKSSPSGSRTTSSGILNGKKVPALFTAYYPSNSKMEGGFTDCRGKKLDPSKYTCAGPKSLKYGTKIQVLGTKTSRDKKVHTVNDVGGAINIVNGRYHFDILMSSAAQCNRFGKRYGYAIIGNGTGYKQVSSSSSKSNSKADKVIAKAKSYIGKVRYNMGSSSPDSGVSDCSGFTQHVFRKAVGKEIGRTTSIQVTKGQRVSKKNLKKGDLVLFQGTYRPGVSHVGIYIGNSKFIHCSSSGGVKISSLNKTYYVQHWMQGRRIL